MAKRVTISDFGTPSDVLATDEFVFRKMGDKKGANMIIKLGKKLHIKRSYPPALAEISRANSLPQLIGKDYPKAKYKHFK